MTEADLISRTTFPVTSESLAAELRTLGVHAGETILVHSSLSSLGWVNGGPVAVIQALLAALGPSGTLVMPAHSADLTDPANWGAPPVPLAWQQAIRDTMPGYDPLTTPTRGMGRIAELFRTWPGAKRSGHPASSFAALGPNAASIVANHSLEDPLGRSSPLGVLYGLAAKVLLIGVGFDKCTALHLAEAMAWPHRPLLREGAPILSDSVRRWISFEVPQLQDGDELASIGEGLLALGIATQAPLGMGVGTIMSMTEAVDHAAAAWGATR